MAEEITIQSLYHRLAEVTDPMTGEKFIQRMNAAGFEAALYELPEDMRKKIPAEVLERRKQYSAKKENYSPLFYAGFWVYKDEEENADTYAADIVKALQGTGY